MVSAKRRHRRYLLSTHLMASPDAEEPSAEHSRALDISESGVGGLFHENWPVGSRVRLEVSLPVDEPPLKVGAIVRHHTGVRYGFEFIDVSHEQRRTIQRACEALAKGSTG